jgi:hypothetical protein
MKKLNANTEGVNMNDYDKEYNFVVKWTQDYPEFQEMIDREMNRMLELSNFKEANEVINMIKAKL